MSDDQTWSIPDHPTPKTEQGFENIRESARKKSMDFAIKRYFEGAKSARNIRYFYNEGKNLITEKDYRDILARQKLELEKTLSGLLRKGDKIVIPPRDSV